ncbi:hypothetical protein KQI63_00420 [bacterium]|nr:hypothetical protein [bacterium]
MILQLNSSDITTLLRHGTKGRDFITVQEIRSDKIVLQMIFPRQLTVTLQHFVLGPDTLTAEMTPWWVRGLVQLYLKWRDDDRARIEDNHIIIQLPAKVGEMVRLNRFVVDSDAVIVDFDVREDIKLV